VVSCAEPQEGKPRDCRLMATAVAQPQNQRLLTAALLRQPETRSLVLVFQVAHGTALSAGLTWQVDEGEVQRLVFQNSDPQGVYAGMPVADDLLAALRRGKQLRVNFALTGRREVVAVTLPLTSFSEASTEFFATEQKSTP
jgi:invasion protein IalB